MKDKETYQARKFTGVINNPLKNGFTHEAIHEKLESLSTFTYACVSDEVSTTGTPHTHFFVCYKNPKLWDTIRRLFNGKAFVESSKGSCQQNKDYIQKPPRHSHEDPTSLAPHERLTDLAVVPREKPHPGAAARETPRFPRHREMRAFVSCMA